MATSVVKQLHTLRYRTFIINRLTEDATSPLTSSDEQLLVDEDDEDDGPPEGTINKRRQRSVSAEVTVNSVCLQNSHHREVHCDYESV